MCTCLTGPASARSLVDFIRSKLSTSDQESLGLCDESVDADLLELSESDVEVVCDALPVMARGRVRREWKKSRRSVAGNEGR